MSIRVLFLAVFLCVALGIAGTSATFDITALPDVPILHDDDNSITVRVCRQGEPTHEGDWSLSGLQVNGSPLYEKIYATVRELYNCSGPSHFLEALVEEMRNSGCDHPRFICDNVHLPLGKGLGKVPRGLIWHITFMSRSMRLRTDGSCLVKEAYLDDTWLREVIQMKSCDFTISGFAEK